jgi:hypothetical protein
MEDWNIAGRAGGVRIAVGVGGMGVAVFVGIAVGDSGVNVSVGDGVSVAFGATAPQPDIIMVLSNTIKRKFVDLFIIDLFSNGFIFSIS